MGFPLTLRRIFKMPFKDLLHGMEKKASAVPTIEVPNIKFIRSDTTSEETIAPPLSGDDDGRYKENSNTANQPTDSPRHRRPRRSISSLLLRTPQSPTTDPSPPTSPGQTRREKQLSHLLDRTFRSQSSLSVNIPLDLPEIDLNNADAQEREAQWERRATALVQGNLQLASPRRSLSASAGNRGLETPQFASRRSSQNPIDESEIDVDIREAIRLHEAGDFANSTRMFGKLADPNGANNALSQVLYGLALRHGWGCTQDEQQAVVYLSSAAANSASIESEALRAGVKKGGAAKGELILAIFELANCFRNGWGMQKDPVAARLYYETAANLGDTDAMNETAWCYLEGFGGKKDKLMAAKYYRLAEEHGSKFFGNSWIWKEKYNQN